MRPPMMYCRPYLYVRCTWPDLSYARMRECTSRTYSCGVPAGMIEGRKGKREKEPIPRFFGRRICNVCLVVYIIGSRTMGIHFIWRLVGTLIFVLCSVFGILFPPHVSTCLFLFRDLRGFTQRFGNWIHIHGYFIWQSVI